MERKSLSIRLNPAQAKMLRELSEFHRIPEHTVLKMALQSKYEKDIPKPADLPMVGDWRER
jgi:hypothetical protein